MARGRALRGIFGTMLDHVLRRARRVDLKAIVTGHPGHAVRLPHAGDEASAYARHLRESGHRPSGWGTRSWPPTMAAAAVDRRSGRVYRGYSAEPDAPLPGELADRLPVSKQRWGSDNCAEVKAAGRAVDDGAHLDDLDIRAVRVSSGSPMPPCTNCETWIPKGAE